MACESQELDFGSAAKITPSVFHKTWASDVDKFAGSKLGQTEAARRARATDGARLKRPWMDFFNSLLESRLLARD